MKMVSVCKSVISFCRMNECQIVDSAYFVFLFNECLPRKKNNSILVIK